jgi:hypothetical protein
VGLTAEERIQAVVDFGFTERQARFLMTVMLFGGVCVPRQYASFAGTAYGQKVNAFFARLIQRRLATRCRCIHNRAWLYQLQHRPLYEAIGEGRSRYRRPLSAARAIERVMRLDSVLRYPEVRWLATEQEKVDFVSTMLPDFPLERLPHVQAGRRARRFPDDVAMGLDATSRPLLLHLVTSPFEDDFRGLLQRYGDLLGALPQWTWRLLFPKVVATAMGRFRVAFRDELATPLSATTLDEFRWYFDQLRRAATTQTRASDPRVRRAQYAFAAPRFRVLYRRWLTLGEPAFDVVSTCRIIEDLANETGRVECDVLCLPYRHLSPLVSPGRFARKGVEEGAKEGARHPAQSQPPASDAEEDVANHCVRDWQRLVDARKPLSVQ